MTRLGEIPEIRDESTHLEESELYALIPDLNGFFVDSPADVISEP